MLHTHHPLHIRNRHISHRGTSQCRASTSRRWSNHPLVEPSPRTSHVSLPALASPPSTSCILILSPMCVNPYPRRTTEPQLTALCPTPELQEIRTYIHHLSMYVCLELPKVHLTRYIKGVCILAQNPPIEYMHVRMYIHTHIPRRSNEAETEERGWLASDAHRRILYTFRGPRLHVCMYVPRNEADVHVFRTETVHTHTPRFA